MKKNIITFSSAALLSTSILAADYTDGDVHKNDYKWGQVSYLYVLNGLPGDLNYDMLEFEFGGRSGIFDFWGYVDTYNVTSDSSSDIASANSQMFMQITPRMSIDGLTGKDLSFGPVKEVYVAADLTWDGASYAADNYSTNEKKIGLGSDVMVPWLGKVGLNLFATYNSNHKDWNGYQISTNWFKPLYYFNNKSYVAYQGYLDYQFGLNDSYSTSSSGGTMYNGFYWHSERYALGYGLQGSSDIYGIKDSSHYKSSGISHYIAFVYKL